MSNEEYQELIKSRKKVYECMGELDKAIEEHHAKHKEFNDNNTEIGERILYNAKYIKKEAEISEKIQLAYDELHDLEIKLGLRQ